jgi:hypothetical protein
LCRVRTPGPRRRVNLRRRKLGESAVGRTAFQSASAGAGRKSHCSYCVSWRAAMGSGGRVMRPVALRNGPAAAPQAAKALHGAAVSGERVMVGRRERDAMPVWNSSPHEGRGECAELDG